MIKTYHSMDGLAVTGNESSRTAISKSDSAVFISGNDSLSWVGSLRIALMIGVPAPILRLIASLGIWSDLLPKSKARSGLLGTTSRHCFGDKCVTREIYMQTISRAHRARSFTLQSMISLTTFSAGQLASWNGRAQRAHPLDFWRNNTQNLMKGLLI